MNTQRIASFLPIALCLAALSACNGNSGGGTGNSNPQGFVFSTGIGVVAVSGAVIGVVCALGLPHFSTSLSFTGTTVGAALLFVAGASSQTAEPPDMASDAAAARAAERG